MVATLGTLHALRVSLFGLAPRLRLRNKENQNNKTTSEHGLLLEKGLAFWFILEKGLAFWFVL